MTKKLALLRQRLLHVNGREPLSRMSLVVIIVLDLFVLHIIFTGLHEHRLNCAEARKIGRNCRRRQIVPPEAYKNGENEI